MAAWSGRWRPSVLLPSWIKCWPRSWAMQAPSKQLLIPLCTPELSAWLLSSQFAAPPQHRCTCRLAALLWSGTPSSSCRSKRGAA